MLTFELVQQAGASGGGGWDGLCALADIVALPARIAHKPVIAPSSATGPRSRSSTPVRPASTDTNDVSPAATEAILAAIGTAAATAIGEVSKANSRMHERLLASTIQWLTTKIADERHRALSVKVTDNKHISPVHAVGTTVTAASPSPSNAGGIAFRGERCGVNTTGAAHSSSGPNSASGGVNTHTPSSGRATGNTPSSGRLTARSTSFDFVLNSELDMEATPSPETKDNRDQATTSADSATSSLRRSRSSPLPVDTVAIRSSPIAGTSPARQPITPHSTNPNNTSTSDKHSPLNLSFSPQQAATTLSKLSGDWFEVRLILKQVPTTGEGWSTFSQVVKSAPAFYQQLNSAAKAGGMPRAALLRVVLPFDEDTSSSDQAHVDSRRRPMGTTSSPSSASSPQRGPIASVTGVDDHTLTALQQQAVVLRKLIRIKMADEADLQQAQSATSLLQRFCTATEAIASQQGCSPQSLVVGFERETMM